MHTHAKGKNKRGLSGSSDQWKYQKNQLTSILPGYIRRLQVLRSTGILPPQPETIIINDHYELAVDIQPSHTSGLEHLRGHTKDLAIPRGTKVLWEPPIETLDLYVVDDFSQRLRFYFQSGILVSIRIITVQDEKPGKKGARILPVTYQNMRAECVFVERKDIPEGPAKKNETFLQFADRFLTRHQKRPLAAVVFKRVKRGNFGEDTLWDHRNLIISNKNGVVDATQKYNAIGMKSYIAYVIQEVHKHEFAHRLSLNQVRDLVSKVINSEFTPEEGYKRMVYDQKTTGFRIELEFKGEYLNTAASHVSESLFHILNQAKIPFIVSRERKIKQRR